MSTSKSLLSWRPSDWWAGSWLAHRGSAPVRASLPGCRAAGYDGERKESRENVNKEPMLTTRPLIILLKSIYVNTSISLHMVVEGLV